MSIISVVKNALGVNGAVINGAEEMTDGSVRVTVTIKSQHRHRCGICGRMCRHYDNGRNETRLWRTLDLCNRKVFIVSSLERVRCPEHGIVVCQAPWAEHNSRFTRVFEDRIAWLAVATTNLVVSMLMRIKWETVGDIARRVYNRIKPGNEFDSLVEIGVDETSYKKGHKYITVVINHRNNHVIWVHEGHGKEIFSLFLNELTEEQKKSIRLVSGDGARWIQECIDAHLPNARRCMDPFHVVSWVTDLVDYLRKDEWNRLKHTEFSKQANEIKGSRYSLIKNPENLTPNQTAKLIEVFQSSPKLQKAYQLKEMLREVFKREAQTGCILLNRWIVKARNSLIEEFDELADKIERNKEAIMNTLESGLSNARIEATNNKIKVITRRAYGFRNLDNLIGLVMLACGGVNVRLPWEEPLCAF